MTNQPDARAIDALLRRRAAIFGLLTIAAAAVYLNALANGFALDDTAIIRDNARVHSLGDMREIWLTPYWPFFGVELGLWRPFAIFGYALQWAAGGGSPAVFHAVNIALHVLATLLGFLLIERLTARGPALAGALVFAVHPVHTEAVANIVGQAELITACALIGACLVHATRPPGLHVSWGRRAALLALFTVAILTKEHAVVLPGLLLATDLAQRRIPLSLRGCMQYVHALLMPMLLLGAVLAAYMVFRYEVLEGALFGVQAGPQLHYLREEYRVLNALRAFPELLRLLVWPASLSADYSPAMILPVESFTLMTAVGAMLLAATVVLALMTPWNPAVGFPAAWFLVGIITVSNLLFPVGVLVAERTLYLPSLALSAAIAYAWLPLSARASPATRRLAPVLLLVVLAAGAARTWVRNPDWDTTQSVLYSVLRDHPDSYKAQWTQATWEWQSGRPENARYHFELALRLYPRDTQLMTEVANFLLVHGQPARAMDLLQEAHTLHPFVPRTKMLLAQAYLANAKYADALRIANSADSLGIGLSASMAIRAAAYEGLGDREQAVAAWRYILRRTRLEPVVVWAYAARTLALSGYPDDAAAAIRRGLDAAAADSASVATLTAAARALEAGCWTSGAAAQPGCDPLAPAGTQPPVLQNATDLQNARQPAADATP